MLATNVLHFATMLIHIVGFVKMKKAIKTQRIMTDSMITM